MRRITFHESSDDLTDALDPVAAGREVMARRPSRDAVVLVPLSDCEALMETIHLLRSPANSRRPLDAMERLESRPASSTT